MPSNEKVYCSIYPWMTSELKLSGYDLLVFAYIHSLTRSGERTFYASAESISKTWYGDETRARTIKDSLKTLKILGYISARQETIKGHKRNVYISNGETIRVQISNGMPAPQKPKKRRNLIDSGTVPLMPAVSPYHSEGGTMLPLYSGTDGATTGGTVPQEELLEEIYNKYSLNKGVEINTKEEEKNFEIIFFFKNAKDPKAEVRKFVDYNTRMGWEHGELDTHEKRIIAAETRWRINEGFRVPKEVLEFIRVLYVWGRENNEAGVECLIDKTIRGKRLDMNTCHLSCKKQVQDWLESHCEIVRTKLHDVIQSRNLFYYSID